MRVRSWEEFYTGTHSLRDVLRWGVTHGGLVEELAGLDRVLEVGTGSGMMSALVARLGPRTVTVDTSAGVLGGAAGLYGRLDAPVRRVRGDGFALPFRAGAFSACFSQGLLEHFDDDAAAALVGEQLRVAPVAYVSVPSFYYPHAGRWGPGLIGNERLRTRRRWAQMLARPGWHVEARYYADPKIASFAGVTLPWPAQLLLTVRRAG